jgi:hypothetical protein
MKPGDLVKNKNGFPAQMGLFMGLKNSNGYQYAEVMWFTRSAPNGDRVSSIQSNLLEVVK